MTPVDVQPDETLTIDDVDRLVANGEAEPLLVGYRLVPIRYRQQWWQVPEGMRLYRPAPRASAEVFDALRESLAAAAQAVHAATTHRDQRDS